MVDVSSTGRTASLPNPMEEKEYKSRMNRHLYNKLLLLDFENTKKNNYRGWQEYYGRFRELGKFWSYKYV